MLDPLYNAVQRTFGYSKLYIKLGFCRSFSTGRKTFIQFDEDNTNHISYTGTC